jgi:hypothetical protein
MRQLESERRRLEVEHAAKRPNKPSSKRRPNTAEDDDDDDEEEPQARTKAQPKRRKVCRHACLLVHFPVESRRGQRLCVTRL